MKKLFVAGLCILAMSFTIIESNFQAAVQKATIKHQLMLINFSGSDWCGPCMRMRKEIFENKTFSKMADSALVFFNADFPRNKKTSWIKTHSNKTKPLPTSTIPMAISPTRF